MARPRIGLGFEGVLHPWPFTPGGLPDLARTLDSTSAECLVAAAARYDLIVYPLRRRAGAAALIRAWLLLQFERHFRDTYPAAVRHACALVGQLDVVDDRAAVELDVAVDVGAVPDPIEIERILDRIFGAGEISAEAAGAS